MIISKKSIDFIIFQEVSSPLVYDKKYRGLTWPGGESGATIGIGYDLGYQSRTDIEKDWLPQVGTYQVSILQMFAGLRGERAKVAIMGNKLAANINIPFESAYNVFVNRSLAAYGRKALQIYPGLDELTPDAIGAIVSLIYNRGSSLEGDRRKEMKAIKPLIQAKDYTGIAEQIDAMKRLWANGLVQRREKEAAMVKNSLRQYGQDELIKI